MTSAYNPYLPAWEYVPDAEPHIFGDRLYVYGSHDQYNGQAYCLNDYVCWSAPVSDLGDWRYEGVIYRRTDDPLNKDGIGCLYAPDVTQGADGRYYLYYVLSNQQVVSVAVADTPIGPYAFYGYVHYVDGRLLGEAPGDEPQFDPAVLTEGDRTYLYTGFCLPRDSKRSGAMATVLGRDMLTILEGPAFVLPSAPYSAGSGFEGHEFFEAPSIRKVGDWYYLIYSSVLMYELCYAKSDRPTGGFTYGGVVISNNDMGIDSYKPAELPAFYGGNNHGGMIDINGEWFIFYHRHTNGTNYSRQTCAEPIHIDEAGRIKQVELTSCGLNRGPLPATGEYSSHIACNLFTDKPNPYTGGMGGNGFWLDSAYPRLMQDGHDTDPGEAYVFNLTDSATVGYKYFEFNQSKLAGITVRGYGNGYFEVRTAWDGPVLGTIPVTYHGYWNKVDCAIDLPDGTHPLYFVYRGQGFVGLASFAFS